MSADPGGVGSARAQRLTAPAANGARALKHVPGELVPAQRLVGAAEVEECFHDLRARGVDALRFLQRLPIHTLGIVEVAPPEGPVSSLAEGIVGAIIETGVPEPY